MHQLKFVFFLLIILLSFVACKKSNSDQQSSTDAVLSFTVNDTYNGSLNYLGLNSKPTIKAEFTEPINSNTISKSIILKDANGGNVALTTTISDNGKELVVKPLNDLKTFSNYTLSVTADLQTSTGARLINPLSIKLSVGFDDRDKFSRISETELLDLVQKQTFKYFWDFAHPVSGLARERNTSGDVVTTGGSGFGIMAIVAAVHRGFISRAEGLERLQKITTFLKTKAQRFHGAFPHWLNGNTGAVVPFSAKDNGADLVETSFLMQGLLTARQYFNRTDVSETSLRSDINELWNGVEWNWFRKDNENVLYWHWSPNYNWEMNHKIQGWNESLITYVLAASSTTHSIPKSVYDNGWARNGTLRNGNSYYGVQLPLGPQAGGPLFFEHYSFLGINPNGLADAYTNYETQAKAHTLINYNYCKANPLSFYGYSENCWGLTASDIPEGYTASSPTNDRGVIAPTAALSSFPYTPVESMKALEFFYYKLGDKIWKEYGFADAFSLHHTWFASSFLAIDQGPIIIMIENHRSGLLWDLFMSSPEIKSGMRSLGFQSPYL